MKTFSVQALDEMLSGTGVTWYSPAHLNSVLGSGDMLAIHAWVTNAAASSSLTLQVEHSADGEGWLPVGSPQISTAVASNTAYYGKAGFFPMLMAYVRLNVSLSGTNPQCRLKVHVTGRSF